MSREFVHIAEHPMSGDIVEVTELHKDEASGEMFDFESMIRVVHTAEERVWFKEYGMKGHQLISLRKWRERMKDVRIAKVVQRGDKDLPF